jgi:hypothetical protein
MMGVDARVRKHVRSPFLVLEYRLVFLFFRLVVPVTRWRVLHDSSVTRDHAESLMLYLAREKAKDKVARAMAAMN